jgi:hypothetical protein
MRIKVIGECDCARALRGLLRKAGFAVSEFLPAEVIKEMPSGGYVVRIDEGPAGLPLYFDSVHSELERNILRHVTELSARAVVLDRPGGQVHSDREIRIVVPAGAAAEQNAVEFGVLRGLVDTVGGGKLGVPRVPWFDFAHHKWYRKLFGGKR